MLKTLIAGFAALGLITAAAPQKAHAGGDDVLRGIVAGAIIIGTIAALDEAYDNRRYGDSHRHSHGHSHGHRHGQRHKHVRVKPKYGHHTHKFYRHGTRIYSDHDNRHRHDDYGYRHRDHKHADKRHHGHRNAHKGHRHKPGYGHTRVRDDHARDHRHKGHKGLRHVDNRRDDRYRDDRRYDDKPRKRDAKRIREERLRLAAKDARIQAQIDARTAYVRLLNPGWDQ